MNKNNRSIKFQSFSLGMMIGATIPVIPFLILVVPKFIERMN